MPRSVTLPRTSSSVKCASAKAVLFSNSSRNSFSGVSGRGSRAFQKFETNSEREAGSDSWEKERRSSPLNRNRAGPSALHRRLQDQGPCLVGEFRLCDVDEIAHRATQLSRGDPDDRGNLDVAQRA